MHRKKRHSWHEKSTNAKKYQYIRVKNRIQKEAHKGRIFYSPHVLDANDKWFTDDMLTDHFWFDAYFMSKKHRMFYNADVISAGYRALELIRDYASDVIEERHPELADALEWEFHPSDKKGFSRMVFKYPEKVEERRRIHDDIVREFIAKHETYTVDCVSSFDHKYRHGVGFSIVIPQVKISVADFNAWIEEFWANGEVAPRSTATLTQQDLKGIFSHLYIGEYDEIIGVSETN